MNFSRVTKPLAKAMGNVSRVAHEGYTMYRKAYDDAQKTDRMMKAKENIRKGFF